MLYSRFLLVTHLKYSSVFIYIAESLHCSLETITALLIGHTPIQRFLVLKKKGFPRWLGGKEPMCQCRRLGFDPWIGKISWRGNGNSHGQRNLVGYSPWGCKKAAHDRTIEHAHTIYLNLPKYGFLVSLQNHLNHGKYFKQFFKA